MDCDRDRRIMDQKILIPCTLDIILNTNNIVTFPPFLVVATDGVYYFTRGVDLFGTQLLCITDSPSIALRDIVWKSTNMTYNNPLDYGSLENGDYTLVCSGGSLSLAKVSLLIQGMSILIYKIGLDTSR